MVVVRLLILINSYAAGAGKQAFDVKFTGWEEYRLGDMVKWRQWKEDEPDGKAYHLAHFPGSIAALCIS